MHQRRRHIQMHMRTGLQGRRMQRRHGWMPTESLQAWHLSQHARQLHVSLAFDYIFNLSSRIHWENHLKVAWFQIKWLKFSRTIGGHTSRSLQTRNPQQVEEVASSFPSMHDAFSVCVCVCCVCVWGTCYFKLLQSARSDSSVLCACAATAGHSCSVTCEVTHVNTHNPPMNI